MELCGIDERAEMRDSVAVGKDITAGIGRPLQEKLAVIDKDVRASRGVRAIFEIIDAAIPEQRRAIRIKKDGGKTVVLAIQNQLARGSAKQSFGKRTRRKIRIK